MFPFSNTFQSSLNYASTPNIPEVMKFSYLGDQNFETDYISCNEVLVKIMTYLGCFEEDMTAQSFMIRHLTFTNVITAISNCPYNLTDI